MLVVTVIKTKPDQGGAETTRPWAELLHQGHSGVGPFA